MMLLLKEATVLMASYVIYIYVLTFYLILCILYELLVLVDIPRKENAEKYIRKDIGQEICFLEVNVCIVILRDTLSW